MKCTNCGSDQIRPAELSTSTQVGGYVFEGTVPGLRCDGCGEEFLDGSGLEAFDLQVAGWLVNNGVASREAFRFMRRAIALRASDLAALLDVTPETISHWETGKHELPRNVLALLGAIVLDHVEGRTTTVDRLRKLGARPGLAKAGPVHLPPVEHLKALP